MSKKILKLYAIAIILGIMTGAMSSYFQLFIRKLSHLLNTSYIYLAQHGLPSRLTSAFISMLMVFIAWVLVKHIAPEASGSGVQEIEGALLHQRPIFWRRLLPVKFIGGILTISAKMVVGREGPTIQMGGNLGAMLGEWFRVSLARRDALIAAGSAAGLAAAFNAPLAGILFILEEMRRQFNFSFLNFKTVAICCAASTITLHIIIGAGPAIPMSVFQLPSLKSLSLFFIFGILVGFVGLVFNTCLMKTLSLLDRLSPIRRLVYVLIVSFFMGYSAYAFPAIVGGGYDIIEKSLIMNPSFSILLIVLGCRFITTLLCYGIGIPGGIFAPLLALGSLLGLSVSIIFQWFIIDPSIHPGMFAVAGMGALFSAAVRAPITGIVLVVEMTQNYSLILPLMVTCLTSTTIMQLARNEPIYTQLLKRTLCVKSTPI